MPFNLHVKITKTPVKISNTANYIVYCSYNQKTILNNLNVRPMENNTIPKATPGSAPRPSSDYQSIDAYLVAANISIKNGKHPEIAPLLAAFGYTAAELTAGENLLGAALDFHQLQKKEYGEQFTATDYLQSLLTNSKEAYMIHLAVARVAFKKDRGILAQLLAGGSRKRTQAGWLGQAKTFYNNLLSDEGHKSAMARFGQTQAKLTAAKALVDSVETAMAAQTKETGEAQTATRVRDKAIDELAEWHDDYVDIARVALKGHPTLMEILGLKAA